MIQTDAPLWVPSREVSDAAAGQDLPPGGRQRLPNRRRSLNLRFRFPVDPERPGRRYHLGIGFYGEEGWRPGEIFLRGPKTGSDADAQLDDAATYASMLMQHGCRAEALAHGSTREAVMRVALQIAAAIEAFGPGVDLQHLGVEP